jgi:hypothetical protein
MPANTANRSYTYATSDDANDLALISQRLAEQVDTDMQGAYNKTWTSYTPTLTNVTLGNGTLTGNYIRMGALCFAQGRLVFGSTTAFTASPYFGLPFSISGISNALQTPLGNLSLYDSSAGAYRFWQCAPGGSGYFLVRDPGGSTITAASPWTWATGDIVQWSLAYQVAAA